MVGIAGSRSQNLRADVFGDTLQTRFNRPLKVRVGTVLSNSSRGLILKAVLKLVNGHSLTGIGSKLRALITREQAYVKALDRGPELKELLRLPSSPRSNPSSLTSLNEKAAASNSLGSRDKAMSRFN